MSTFCVNQEGPVNALALNRDNTRVAIGGRNVFKVYVIEDDKFKEVCNLRASKNLNLSFSCNDVSWSSTDDHYLATAATNGHVCVWNLTKMGKAMQEQDYQDHKRTVNKVNFHASEPNKLISGSQDGTMRYFDIRMKSAVSVFYSNTESVRDVQFSPHNPYTFSAVSDNGSVQLWDIRKTDKCQQQYTAHSGPVFACDWHPESTWLATASRDKTIKVWDLTNKPTLEYTIHTIASIGHVKWRPQRKYHIASCALVIDCSINIWDVRRPYIPFASFNEHRDIASGVAWRGDPDIFLSSGRDCTLYQHNFNNASRPASKANPHGISLNNLGEVVVAQKINIISNPNISSSNALAKTVGLMRKISNTQPINNFHQAASSLNYFSKARNPSNQSDKFIALATKYQLSGQSVSELCEHNSIVAQENGKPQIAKVWRLLQVMFAEEYMSVRNMQSTSNIQDDVSLTNVVVPQVNITTDRDSIIDNDQRSRGGGDTPAAQFSGGDDETENEDQVDHIADYNSFPTYLNSTSGLPKGDFYFGENELDMDLDENGGNSTLDFHNGYCSKFTTEVSRKLNETEDEFMLPSEAFSIRHEIRNRSPPPEQQTTEPSPILKAEPLKQAILNEVEVQPIPPGLVSVTHLPRKPGWDPGSIVGETLRHHAALGDVQTAACVLIVLGDYRKLLKLTESVEEHWLIGYIDLLSHYNLLNNASQVIKLSWVPAVFQLNQQSTRINSSCSVCAKPLLRIGWLCDRCHSTAFGLCSVCHQVVKGLYAWCQGCSHGGHVRHVRQWLQVKRTCPTGCGHVCDYR